MAGARWRGRLGALGAAVLAMWLVAAGSAPAWVGGREVRVNETVEREQRFPDIVATRHGGFAVVWESGRQDGHRLGVYARRFSRTGRPLSGELQVNTTIAGDQSDPSVAPNGRGGFVVAWSSGGLGSRHTVYARRFAPNGIPRGGEIPVSTGGLGLGEGGEMDPAVTAVKGGGFTVAWEVGELDSAEVFARRFDAFGEPFGGEVPVTSTATGGSERTPALAQGPGRGFTAVWERVSPNEASSIFARRFDADGRAAGPEIRAALSTRHDQSYPDVAPASGGGSVITWQSYAQDGSGSGIYVRRFDSSGNPRSGELSVNTTTSGQQVRPAIAATRGGFVVAWQSNGQDGDRAGIYARRLNRSGWPLGREIRVNAIARLSQFAPAITASGRGFVAAWTHGRSGPYSFSLADVRARRFLPR